MKSPISNVWLLGLVALFIFIFAGYVAITISYSTTFKMKNEMLLIIEKHNGMTSRRLGNDGTSGAFETINMYLYGMGYRTMSSCPANDGWTGVYDLVEGPGNPAYFNSAAEAVNANRKYYYCFKKIDSPYVPNKKLKAVYYKVQLFYTMDLPVLSQLFTFRVEGTTSDIYLTNVDSENRLVGK